MHKRSILWKIMFVALIISAIGTIVFIALIPVSTSYLYGWLMSVSVALIGHFIALYTIQVIVKHKKSKTAASVLTGLRIGLVYVLHLVMIIILVSVDKHHHGMNFMDKGAINALESPISLFVYMGGIAIIPVSTFIANAL